MGRRRGLWRHEHGFTLAEVMITIVIMGILAGIALPAWFWLVETRRVDSAATQLVADMRLANASATNQLTDWRIVFRTDGTRVANCPSVGKSADYCLMKNTPSGGERTARYLPENTKILGTTVPLDTSADLLAPSAVGVTRTLKFKSDGSASAAGVTSPPASYTVTVSSNDGAPSHVISLNTVTSKARID